MNDCIEDKLVAVYCLTDDLLKALGHTDNAQAEMSDSEVVTTALLAALCFSGNYAEARRWLNRPDLMPRMLGKSRFSRRLNRIAPLFEPLFALLGQLWSEMSTESEYVIDSMPVPCCDNIRIRRSRLYPRAEHGDAFGGYIASKRRYFYGVRIHLLITADGAPVEVFLAPGAQSDVRALRCYRFDLPPESTIYADKGYTDYREEDLLTDAGLHLSAIRRKNSRRAVSQAMQFIQHYKRKRIETVNSLIERLLPRHIHATTARGFELKVFLFVLAASFNYALR